MALYQGATQLGQQTIINASADDGGLITLSIDGSDFTDIRRVGYLFILAELDFGIGERLIETLPIHYCGVCVRTDISPPVVNNHIIVIAVWNREGLSWRATA